MSGCCAKVWKRAGLLSFDSDINVWENPKMRKKSPYGKKKEKFCFLRPGTSVGALFLLLTLGLGIRAAAFTSEVTLSEREKERKERVEQYDRQNLREKDEFVVDRSEEFLAVPDTEIYGEFDVAETPPVVKFQILPDLEPEFFGEGEEYYQAGWANWAKVTRGEDNRFYFAASDHRGRGAEINIYEYRPENDEIKRLVNVGEVLGWCEDTYTDGKIHGYMGIMQDGTLWAATHRGPQPTEEWYEAGYRGSWLLSYNIQTVEAKNWGVPLKRQEMPEHTLDSKRGLFMATGSSRRTFLVWDVHENKARFDGTPPEGWDWNARSMLLDKETGILWGMDSSESPNRFMSFDPQELEFRRHDVEVPENPVTGGTGILRGHTNRPAKDGWYYWATLRGAFFRFRPDHDNGPEIEVLGTTWDRGRDVLQMALCPAGRYVYYQPKGRPAPLVQYDVKTGRKKAIAFLQDYYRDKYGYNIGEQVYGMEISNDGSFVVIVENGTFPGNFGHPALAVIEIPESERPLD